MAQLDPVPMDEVSAIGWFFFLIYALVRPSREREREREGRAESREQRESEGERGREKEGKRERGRGRGRVTERSAGLDREERKARTAGCVQLRLWCALPQQRDRIG